MDAIYDLFAQHEWVVYGIYGKDKVYIGMSHDMDYRWKNHKNSGNRCSSTILMAYEDVYHSILTVGLWCRWDAFVEEQRQLDLHNNTVNINRAVGLSDRKQYDVKYLSKPGIKAERSRKAKETYIKSKGLPDWEEKQRKLKEKRDRPEAKARKAQRYKEKIVENRLKNLEYRHKPENKERRKKYRQRPEVIARRRELAARPEVKARALLKQRIRRRVPRIAKKAKDICQRRMDW